MVLAMALSLAESGAEPHVHVESVDETGPSKLTAIA